MKNKVFFKKGGGGQKSQKEAKKKSSRRKGKSDKKKGKPVHVGGNQSTVCVRQHITAGLINR